MSFLETIADVCKTHLLPEEYRLTALGGGCVYAEGVKSVRSFSPAEIVLGFKSVNIKISGAKLMIEQFCGGDLVIKGSVDIIERLPC